MEVCLSCRSAIEPVGWACHVCGWHAEFRDDIACLAPRMIRENDGFRELLFDDYRALQSRHFWFTYRRRLIVWALQRHFPRLDSFLEVGCGTAENLVAIMEAYPDADVTGGEPSLHALRIARESCAARLLQMDARAIPFVDAFGGVGAFDVIEHIEDDRRALREMHRACKPGGALILTVPQHPSMWSEMDDVAMHKRRYTRQDLIGRVRTAGFRPLYASSFMSLLLPAMAWSRWRQRRRHGESRIDDGFAIGPGLNRALAAICDIEFRLLMAQVRFRAGGSLLVVAVKD